MYPWWARQSLMAAAIWSSVKIGPHLEILGFVVRMTLLRFVAVRGFSLDGILVGRGVHEEY
jgi:hypothetical protein